MTRRVTKALLDKKLSPPPQCHPCRKEVASGNPKGPRGILRSKVWEAADDTSDDIAIVTGLSGTSPLIPPNLAQGFGIGAADGDLGVIDEGKDGFAIAALDIFDGGSGDPP